LIRGCFLHGRRNAETQSGMPTFTDSSYYLIIENKIKMTHEKHRLALKLKRSEQDFGIRLMQWYGQAPASAFVYDVVLESAAYRAGLIIGDRIINVNGTNVKCAEQIHLLINGQSEAHIQIVRPMPDKIEKLYKTPSFSNPQCSLSDTDSETTTDENIVVKGTLLERFPESHWILKMLGRASYLDQIGVGR
ncbi:hypothetical protein T4C_6818, partial [Trichinella pseudospiralis]